MAIDLESAEVRQARFLSQNPTILAGRPTIKFANPTVVDMPLIGGEGVVLASASGYFVEKITSGSKQGVSDFRDVWVLANSPKDLNSLGERAPEFVATHLVVEDPYSRDPDQTRLVWMKPVDEVVARLSPQSFALYMERLRDGKTPMVGRRTVSSDFFQVERKIAEDNSKFIQSLDQNGNPRDSQPLTEVSLRAISDKYDPDTPYPIRNGGLFLNWGNLTQRKMVSFAMLTPSQRAEYLSIVKPQEQDEYLKAQRHNEFLRLRVKKSEDILRMMGLLGKIRDDAHTSSNDMEQIFNTASSGEGSEVDIRAKLLFALNQPSSIFVAIAAESPANRMRALIQDQEAARKTLTATWYQFRSRVIDMPEDDKQAYILWAGADRMKAA